MRLAGRALRALIGCPFLDEILWRHSAFSSVDQADHMALANVRRSNIHSEPYNEAPRPRPTVAKSSSAYEGESLDEAFRVTRNFTATRHAGDRRNNRSIDTIPVFVAAHAEIERCPTELAERHLVGVDLGRCSRHRSPRELSDWIPRSRLGGIRQSYDELRRDVRQLQGGKSDHMVGHPVGPS